ncbi:hypothetical protein PV729_46605 [Streptomyces europaeiscabiei]|uniref:Secreted protein n=1 Tax=Streptomyces europaeiscabiei TaxID=146819 RepID=A0ABU4NCL8_9ACTN|nr:hypothetical protein [Streptomyces europaeiscabiei]MDX3559038.1 hypothetical protein [Streptomyces europaeiscabiei]MDX3699613.1 hypothetical protein [Streptomyces europaeiscabiei]
MNQSLSTSTPKSTLPEQTRAAALSVDVMNDLDTGQPMLLASTEANQGDLQVVTPAQVLAKVNEQRAQLDRIEALANEYAATVVLPAFIEAHDIELIETSLDGLVEVDPDLASRFTAYSALMADGTFIVGVPEGQNPIVRLAAVRDLVRTLQTKADAA